MKDFQWESYLLIVLNDAPSYLMKAKAQKLDIF